MLLVDIVRGRYSIDEIYEMKKLRSFKQQSIRVVPLDLDPL